MKSPSLKSDVLDLLSSLWGQLRAAVLQPIVEVEAEANHQNIDPDFERWLHGEPSVTKNPTSRYGDRTPGYISGNGLGSMEIGAADD